MNRREFNQYISECSFREMFIEMDGTSFAGMQRYLRWT